MSVYLVSFCCLFGWQTPSGVSGLFWLGRWWYLSVAGFRCRVVRLCGSHVFVMCFTR